MEEVLLKVENLRKLFPVKKGLFSKAKDFVHAVDGISFCVKKKEVFGLAGESGCGKTTAGRLLARLLDPTGGQVYFNGKDIKTLKGSDLREYRKKVNMIFQDPYTSLNPRFEIFDSVAEPLFIHKIGSRTKRKELAMKMLECVGLTPPEDYMNKFPHELSGGTRQRCSIARALIAEPEFIVADEAVSMLDASVRAGVLNLLLDLKTKFDLTLVFITHDLAVGRYMTDRMAVMYLGKIMEIGPTENIISCPQHPYSKALISATPSQVGRTSSGKVEIKGMVMSPINPPPGCSLFQRCLYAKEICKRKNPDMVRVGREHFVACHLVQ